MDQYIGALIGPGFGWAIAGSLGLRNHWRPLMLAVSVIAAVAVALALLHARAMAPPAPFQDAHWQINSVTVVAEVIATVYTQPAFLFVAAGMIAICALGLRLAEPWRTVWTGLGSGCVLMLAAASVLA
ncbi:MAG: hypothetical protein ACP5QR_09875 [Rhizomicrobium sp.]